MTVDPFISFTLGMVVFFLGAMLTRRVRFLRNYNIPEPVSGGIAVALITWGIAHIWGTEISFDLIVRDYLLVMFFATIGLNARLADLIRGGRPLLILLGLTIVFMVLQNIVGLIGTFIFDLPRPVSVLIGSAALIGGHGTAIAWGPTIEASTGFVAAAELGVAVATLGLVAAALLGGPVAKFLIDRNGLTGEIDDGPVVGLPYSDAEPVREEISYVSLMRSLVVINLVVILGFIANEWIEDLGLKLPLFVPCLIIAIIVTNLVQTALPGLPWPARSNALAVISDYTLSVFLAMSLMSMQLWTLAGLGSTVVVVLVMQMVLAIAFVIFLIYRFMGRDYFAAVMSAGFTGFALGATPTAIANMTSVTKRYGPAPLAFILLPLVSAFFVDLANAVIIKVFVG